ncbi:MAG: hypothetical protein RL661_758 [Pseudomonadota bacterium]|jgi:hypothetical protein
MSVAEYGGTLQRIGLDNLMKLADLEKERLDAKAEADALESEYKGDAMGNMTGTVIGAGLAAYDLYNEKERRKKKSRSSMPVTPSADRESPSGEDYTDYQLGIKDRQSVSMRSPRRARLASAYGSTSDGFKSALNDVLYSIPTNFIGGQP